MRMNRPEPLLFSAVLLLLAACLSSSVSDVSPQEWWSERGPVVPHDTFPSDCSICHEGEDWRTIRPDFSFDHLRETGVALEGAHRQAECLRCHNDRGPVALFADRGCAGCHEDEHRGQLGANCESCHGQDSWQPREVIAMHARTRFPLSGAHAAVACFRCHSGAHVGNFTRVDTACESCHLGDLARSTSLDHMSLGWTSDCERCHAPTSFTMSGFRHTTFPLTGTHTTTDCADCHTGGVFAGLSQACQDCHLAEYTGTTDPDHAAGMFPLDCRQCHGTVAWEGALFNHAGIATGCVQCHLGDYNDTTDPNHSLQGFSTACEDCHVTTTWEGAGFDHAGITMGCVDCHLDDYNGTSNPNHAAASFPTSCQNCHSTRTWQGAQFDHTFSVTSGRHAFRCAECHQVPRNYAVVSCTHCHEHRQSEADDEHSGVGGYAWSSPACIACHPTGDS